MSIFSLTVSGCGSGFQAAKTIASQSLDGIGCPTSQSKMWDSFHTIVEQQISLPDSQSLRQALLEAGEQKNLSGPQFEAYVDAFIEHYTTTVQGIEERVNPQDILTWKKALAEAEVGVRITSEQSEFQDRVQKTLSELAERERQLQAACANPEPPPSTNPPAPAGTIWEQLKSAQPEVTGILKTFATAYQSCDVLALQPMTASTPSVQGIVITGDHPAGGKRRDISSVAQVNSSHYYINGQRLAKNSCFEVRNSPLIYDFGGKPFTTASQPQVLDMFKNGGSGTSVLGIDCSAFVFTSLALAGLKMDPDPQKVLKADLVHGIPSTAFKEPQSNGLRCMAKISVTANQSILPGDIIAISGHVNIVDQVGKDPFGIARAKSLSECTATTLSYTGFDFVIAQSSPSKGGIGINRYLAKNYLAESSTYRNGLTQYAIAACRARFGGSATVNSPSLSVVRHKRTPECRATPLTANRQDCVDSCRAL